MKRRNAFTLVELLVVIGIIAVLVGILLPALSRARDQANLVACQSVERQFYAVTQLYATDYRGYILPCVFQGPSAEFDYFEATLIGPELQKVKGSQGSNGTMREQDMAAIIKNVFTCPAADHTGNPNPEDIASTGLTVGGSKNYFGDYIYNQYMGAYKYDTASSTGFWFMYYLKMSQIPGNVIIMMESAKPNFPYPTGYKPYFSTTADLFVQALVPNVNPARLTLNRIGTPHVKRTKMNVLCADGHISTVDPRKDFFTNPNNQGTADGSGVRFGVTAGLTIKNYLWDSKDSLGQLGPPIVLPTGTHPNWNKLLPGI
jgi:prepilin-type N-terminal cleavage/methylation domain-containing protein